MVRPEFLRRCVEEVEGEALELLEELVNCNSFRDNIDGLRRTGELIARKAAQHGMEFQRVPVGGDPEGPFHLYLELPGPGPFYALLGHFDTVHPPDSPFNRFQPRGERIYGPGIQDMKSGVVSALFSLAILRRTLDSHPLPLRVVFNCDEETGSPDSRSLIRDKLAGAAGAFVFEGRYDSQDAIVTARKGIVMGSVRVEGKSAHAGEAPGEGVNAVVEMARKIVRLDELNDPDRGVAVTAGKIQGGVAANRVPDSCQAELDLRFTTPEAEEELTRKAREILDTVFVPGARTHYRLETARPAFVPTPRSRRLRDLYFQAARQWGRRTGEYAAGGGSDGNLTAAMGIPTLDGLGGSGGGPHTENEYILRESLRESMATFSLFMATLLDETRREA